MHPAGPHGSHEARHLGPGEIIAGKYAIVKVLGEGGMGIVYEATHLRLRQRVAVKMLQREMLAHEIIVSRFEREARAAGQLRSRHTARVMDVDITETGLPYMVMEFLEGHDLEVELGTRGRLPHEEAVDYVLQACSAMIEAHNLGIVHRDLKPANLFLAADGESRIIKVLDFGISKVQNEGDSKLTTPDSVMGTALYMSPEQVRSSGTVDVRSDIWSLGIILYELLSGRPPWIGTPTQLAAAIVTEDPPDILALCEVPLEIVAVIGKALRRDAAQRYGDVRELALALAPFSSSTGAGRILAEGLLHGASGSYPRVSIRAREEESAPTMVQANAVSESRLKGEGTAPGWSQHSQPRSKSRALLVGMLAAFAVAFLVLGGLAFAWLRWGHGNSRADDAAAAARSAPHATSALGVEPPPPNLDVAPDPAPPVTGGAALTPAPAVDSAPTAKARPPVARPTAPRPSVAPKPPPSADPNGLPIHL
jgi:eukaryotic-like serine/threonine-protein kinase